MSLGLSISLVIDWVVNHVVSAIRHWLTPMFQKTNVTLV